MQCVQLSSLEHDVESGHVYQTDQHADLRNDGIVQEHVAHSVIQERLLTCLGKHDRDQTRGHDVDEITGLGIP